MLQERILKLMPVVLNENLPQEILNEAVNKYSPPLSSASKGILKGLTPERLNAIMPQLVGAEADSQGFLAKVDDYYADLSIDVPAEGVEIDMSITITKDASGKEIPFPANPKDYVIGSVILQDRNIAKTQDEFENIDFYRYKVIDLGEELKKKQAQTEATNKAYVLYGKLMTEENTDLLKQGLIVSKDSLGLNVYEIEHSTKLEVTGQVQRLLNEKPDVFLSVFSNTDYLEDKSFVLRCLEYGVLNIIGSDIYHIDQKLAGTVDETVKVLKADSALKATLISKEAVAKEML
jgi:hypothetical protein